MTINRQLLAAALATAMLLPAAVVMAAPAAGDVMLAVGQAWVDDNGQKLPIQRGTPLKAGQKIITGSGGHVHVKMKDGSLLAVRPNSVLDIEVFEYDAANPGAGKIRYALKNGVLRSVTGAIGEANKGAFRLNTPIAAIGIRGTDFVTFASDATTRASVKSGAIVVSAFSESCKVESFGACWDKAVDLAASTDSYIELNRKDITPKLLKGNLPLPIDGTVLPASGDVVSVLQENRASTLQKVSPLPDSGAGTEGVHWGRWQNDANGMNGLSVAALLAGGKSIHIASSVFGLGLSKKVDRLPDHWKANFALTGGAAYIQANGQYTAADLISGTLGIDLGTSSFTANAIVNDGAVAHHLQAGGFADWRGYLLADPTKSNTSFTGVVHANQNTVGSVFEKPIDGGRLLTGTMVWNR